MQYDSGERFEDDLRSMLAENKIKAIKYVRLRAHMGLADAKTLVDALIIDPDEVRKAELLHNLRNQVKYFAADLEHENTVYRGDVEGIETTMEALVAIHRRQFPNRFVDL